MTTTKRKLITLCAAAMMAACTPGDAGNEAAADTTAGTQPTMMLSLPKIPRWAIRTTNVRSGRGTSFDVVGSVQRGERVEVEGPRDGWFKIFRDGQQVGYGAESNFQSTPLAQREFRMHSVRFRVDEQGPTAWTLVWTLDLENTGMEAYNGLEAGLKFVDPGRHLLAADTARGIDLTPGQRRTFSGNVRVPAGPAASITNVGAEIRDTEIR